MPLTTETAARKDRRTGKAEMQHRHFATVAAIISSARYSTKLAHLRGADIDAIAEHFADELMSTNPRFDRDRFIAACD